MPAPTPDPTESESGLIFTDRYRASGRAAPDPQTMCRGPCEGMGFYPTTDTAEWPPGAVPDECGYVFVTCRACDGTGRANKHGSKPDIASAVAGIKRAISGSLPLKEA